MRRIPLKTPLFPGRVRHRCSWPGRNDQKCRAGGGWQILTSEEAFARWVAEGFAEELQAAMTNAGITVTIFIKCIVKPLFKIANSLVMFLLLFSQLAGQRYPLSAARRSAHQEQLQVSCILIRSAEPLLIPLPFFFTKPSVRRCFSWLKASA